MNQKKILQLIATSGLSALMFTSCGNDDSEQWRKSNGTQGLINLNEVKKAYQKYKSVEDFEKRINEIYEGDNLLLVGSKSVGEGFELGAFEDLNNDKEISDTDDDLLFTLTVENGRCTLKGHGANSYFDESWNYNEAAEKRYYNSNHHLGGTLFFHWYLMRSWGSYYTPMSRYSVIHSSRTTYRSSPTFKRQIKSNDSFFSRMRRTKGSSFNSAKQSSARSSYVKRTMSSPGFSKKFSSAKKTSGWGARSSSRSSFGSSSSFRGSSGSSI